MTKVTLLVTVCGVLAMAGCVGNREPGTVRSGPQVESPIADAPGGKMASRTVPAIPVIIDDGAPMATVATSGASSPALAQTSAGIFELIR